MTFVSLFTTSPQRADPLTWILAFNLPLVAAISTAVGGIVVAVAAAPVGASPVAILIATALSVSGCLVALRLARPERRYVRAVDTVVPISLGIAATIVSAVGHRGSEVPLSQWSGPLALATVMIALVPYSSAMITAGWGVIGGAVSAGATRWLVVDSEVGEWSLLIAGASSPLHVGIVGAAFSGMVVASVIRWQALPYDREESVDRPTLFESRLREHGTPVAISDDIIALLEKVADGERVSAKQRTDAAVLAADIRSDLVTAMDRSWLDTIPQHNRLVLEDPDNAANRMTRQQRAAIHALIAAALKSPVLDGEPLRVELRALDDGTTAVALSMNITLPEGRRVMMLAPYFVTLKASVHDLEWAAGEQLRMRFKLPPPENQGF